MYQKRARGAKSWIIMVYVTVAFIWPLYALGGALTPSIVAAALAYVLSPLVKWLQLRRIRRVPTSMTIMAFVLLVLPSSVLTIVPTSLNQFNNLAERLPQTVGFVQSRLLPRLNSISGGYIRIYLLYTPPSP